MRRITFCFLFFTAIIVGSVAFGNRAFSYNDDITHPSLTDNVAKVYNANFERKLSDEEIDWLKQGSIKEDLAPRWLNHFYNPETETGLGSMMHSKAWSQSPNYQAVSAALSGGNQTWQKAIESYVKGDRQEAFYALGHVLHLLEDATVPAHTRLDAHPEGDSYENWVVEKIGSAINFNVSPAILSTLDDVFNDLADYSNRNFLSKDTINNGDFSILVVSNKQFEGKNFKCIKGMMGQCAVLVKQDISGKEYYLDNLVHFDYFSLLAPKAISYGAGVVKLFFDEAEKAKQEYEQKSWWDKLKEKANGLWGGLSGASLYAGIAMSDNAPSEESGASGSEAPESGSMPASIATPAPLPLNAVEARDKIVISLPPDTIVAEEKLGGDIAEETSPQDAKIPSVIAEEAVPGQAKLPESTEFLPGMGGAPVSIPSPTPTPVSTSTPASDTTPPETAILSGPAAVSSSTIAIFEFSSSEATSTFVCQLDSATSTACSLPQEYDGLAEGSHTFKVSATDEAGNQDATPAEYSWIIDLAPEAEIILRDYSLTKLDFTVAWSSSSSDAVGYDIQYKLEEETSWRDWAMATTTLEKKFFASQDNVRYQFRVRAMDGAGMAGAWQEISAPISQKPVIFNEIMYDPNPGADSYYEYIELYNRSPFPVDLANWKLAVGSSGHTLSSDALHDGESTVLATGAFALIADKAAATTTPSIYDGYYSVPVYSLSALRLNVNNTSSLNLLNSGAALTLEDGAGNIVDQVNYSSSWGAQNNGKSLERINYNNIYSGNNEAWRESSTGGTPNAPNSVLDVLAGTPIKDSTLISQNTIWSKAGSPYLLYSNSGASPTIAAGVTLTIEPGVVIKPQNKYYYSLSVKGTLKAEGTSDNPILITSKNETPEAGDWGTVIYFGPESINSSLSYATFKFGGYEAAFPLTETRPAVVVDQAAASFNNCLFQSIQGRAIDLLSSNSSVENSRFLNNTAAGIRLTGSSTPAIKNNVFQNSGYLGTAVKIENGSKPLIESNNISGFNIAIWLESAYPDFSGNSANDNSYNGVFVSDNSVFSQSAAWQDDLTYLLESNAGQYPTVATGTILTIEPGAVIKPLSRSNFALKIEGGLLANGGDESGVINFTSFKDDSLGGDSNNDLGAELPDGLLAGDWSGILFAEGSQSTLKFVRLQYGGYTHGLYGDWRDLAKVVNIQEGAIVARENVSVE